MAVIKPFTGVDDRVQLADVIPLSTPFTLNIFPTNLCNFRCSYCAHSLGGTKLSEEFGVKPETMSIDTLKEIVRQARCFPERFKLVSMMGHGEPLLNPALPDMIHIVKEAGIADRIDIITNASLMTKERARALVEAGIDVIRISLQGIRAEKYKEISAVTLDFKEFIANLAYLYKHRKQCRIYVKTMDISLEPDEEEQFYSLFTNISDRMFIDRVKPVYDGVSYREELREITTDRYGNRHEKRKICPQPFYMLSLWPDGEASPCDAIYKAAPLGNIAAITLTDMWKSDMLKDFRILQLKGLRHRDNACRRCCAPDDVIHPQDVLDGHGRELLRKLSRKEK